MKRNPTAKELDSIMLSGADEQITSSIEANIAMLKKAIKSLKYLISDIDEFAIIRSAAGFGTSTL